MESDLFPADYLYTNGSEGLPQLGTSESPNSSWLEFLNTTVKGLTVVISGKKNAGNPNVKYNPNTGDYTETGGSSDLMGLLLLAAIVYALTR